MTASHTTRTCVQARGKRVCLVGDTAPPGFGGVRPAVVLPMEAVCAIGAVGPRPEQPPATAGFLFRLIYRGGAGVVGHLRIHNVKTKFLFAT